MGLVRQVIVACLLGAAVAVSGLAAAEEAAPPPAKDGELLSRIDFGNAYVMGQTIQSGAAYLLNRKQSEIQSMLKTRTDFRPEIRADAEVVDDRRP
jgi:hypothetical protein